MPKQRPKNPGHPPGSKKCGKPTVYFNGYVVGTTGPPCIRLDGHAGACSA